MADHDKLIYTDMLDNRTKLEIYCFPQMVPIGEDAYCWRIRFFDENDNEFSSESNGQLHDSQAACEADARIHFLMEMQIR